MDNNIENSIGAAENSDNPVVTHNSPKISGTNRQNRNNNQEDQKPVEHSANVHNGINQNDLIIPAEDDNNDRYDGLYLAPDGFLYPEIPLDPDFAKNVLNNPSLKESAQRKEVLKEQLKSLTVVVEIEKAPKSPKSRATKAEMNELNKDEDVKMTRKRKMDVVTSAKCRDSKKSHMNELDFKINCLNEKNRATEEKYNTIVDVYNCGYIVRPMNRVYDIRPIMDVKYFELSLSWNLGEIDEKRRICDQLRKLAEWELTLHNADIDRAKNQKDLIKEAIRRGQPGAKLLLPDIKRLLSSLGSRVCRTNDEIDLYQSEYDVLQMEYDKKAHVSILDYVYRHPIYPIVQQALSDFEYYPPYHMSAYQVAYIHKARRVLNPG